MSNNKPVLLSGEQMEAIRNTQQQECAASPLSISPSANATTRALVAKELDAVAQEKQAVRK